MANRFNQLLPGQQYQSIYVPLPFEDILKAGAIKQGQRDAVEAERLDLLGKSWKMLPKDMEHSKKIKQEIDSKLQSYANKDFTDPMIKSQWEQDKRSILNRFSLTGDVGNIDNNYNAYKAYEKDLLGKAKDLGWSDTQLRTHLENAKNSFEGTIAGEDDFRQFSGKGVYNYVDPNKWVSTALKDVEHDTGIIGLSKLGSLNEVTEAYRHGTIDERSYNKIVNALTARAMGDQHLLNSLEQEGAFMGQSGWSNFIQGTDKNGNYVINPRTRFGAILSGAATGGAYNRQNMDYMQVKDPLALERAKKKEDQEYNFTSETGALEVNTDWVNILGLKGIFNPDGSINSDGNSLEWSGVQKVNKNAPNLTSKQAREDYAVKQVATLALNLGLTVKRPDGTTDFEATKKAVMDYGSNLASYANKTVMLSPTIEPVLSNYYFGKTSNMHNMMFYDQGNTSSATEYTTEEQKNKFKGSRVIGLDYTADVPGAMKLAVPTDTKDTYGDKPFIAVNRNVDLQRGMKPIQQLTKATLTFATTGKGNDQAKRIANNLTKSGVDVKGAGVPVAVSEDEITGNQYMSFQRVQNGVPVITVLTVTPDGQAKWSSLEEAQEERTGFIFNEIMPQFTEKDRPTKVTYDDEDTE